MKRQETEKNTNLRPAGGRNLEPGGEGGPPSLDGAGRDAKGRFVAGNKGGRGSPLSGLANQLRSRLLASITEGDLEDVADELTRRAKAGEPWAVVEFLNRVCGKPTQQVELDVNDNRPTVLQVNYHVVEPGDVPEAEGP